MHVRIKTCLSLTVLLMLTGCEDYAADWVKKVRGKVQSEQANWVSVPTLPIIEQSVFELTPPRGPGIDRLMDQVCGMVQGTVSQEDARSVLSSINERQRPAAEKLINAGRGNQATACAASLSMSVMRPVNVNEFSQTVELDDEAGASSLQIDKTRLNQALARKMAIVRTNADIYALIAKHLEQKPGLTLDEYRNETRKLFATLALTYLERVEDNMLPTETEYTLLSMNAVRFTFNTSTGALYEYGYDGLTLRQKNIIWYGYGQLLGKPYHVQAKYFDDKVGKALNHLNRQAQ